LRNVVVGAVASVLAQACSGGVMPSPPSTLGAAGAQGSQSYAIYGADRYFTLEWRPDERRGRPVVSGYVTNVWGMGVRDVRLRVETLDAAGNVSATDIGYVFGDVTPGARVYFEVPVQQKAGNYRVSVLSFDPSQCRG
jgi:hypothetical protein